KFWERFQGKPFFKRVFLGHAKKALKGVGKTRVFPTFDLRSRASQIKSNGESVQEKQEFPIVPTGSLAIFSVTITMRSGLL
ncbi:MAG: hypothetical protein J1F28_03080, partial [Oscillospiraceae bacterium]|nr:hypothetical protein [Oscillospiraceae bacterium]